MASAPIRKADIPKPAARAAEHIIIPDCPCGGEPIVYVTRGPDMYVFDMAESDRVSLCKGDILSVFCTVCEQRIEIK